MAPVAGIADQPLSTTRAAASLVVWKITFKGTGTPCFVIADALKVPAVLTNGTFYELDLCNVSDFRSILQAVHVDERFSTFATRINKVCQGTANCASVPMARPVVIWRMQQEPSAKKHRQTSDATLRILSELQ